MTSELLVGPWVTLGLCLLLLFAPGVAAARRSVADWPAVALAGAAVATLLASNASVAYMAAAAAALLHAGCAWRASRTGAATLVLSGALATAVAGAMATGRLTAAFILSTLAVILRVGPLPFNVGVSSLCDRAPAVQTQQLASAIALVFVHLRFVDHHAAAVALAPVIVRYGAAAAFTGALMSLVQKDLAGFFRATTAVHGGMIVAALGAASLHNYAAALLFTVATGLSLGGLGIMMTALETRVGTVVYARSQGRVHALPRLAAAFALFGAASVAMPGTAGFVADDLLLHALWMDSAAATVAVILSSAMLAVSTLICYSFVFLGRRVALRAPDLVPRERAVALALALVALLLGFAPGLLLYPADVLLEQEPSISSGPR